MLFRSAQRSTIIAICAGVVLLVMMGAVPHLWAEEWVLVSFASAMELVGLFYAIAMIPICMRMCSPMVAATQFTIYMAVGNFGRPLGAWLAAQTAGAGNPQLFYWSLAAIWAVVGVILFNLKLPTENRAGNEVAEHLPQASGLPAIEN